MNSFIIIEMFAAIVIGLTIGICLVYILHIGKTFVINRRKKDPKNGQRLEPGMYASVRGKQYRYKNDHWEPYDLQ